MKYKTFKISLIAILALFGNGLFAQSEIVGGRPVKALPDTGWVVIGRVAPARNDTVTEPAMYVDTVGFVRYKEKARVVYEYEAGAVFHNNARCINCPAFSFIIWRQ